MNNYIFIGFLSIIIIASCLRSDDVEGFAPYFTPWWREYYKEDPYKHPPNELPYWNGSWYWWRKSGY